MLTNKRKLGIDIHFIRGSGYWEGDRLVTKVDYTPNMVEGRNIAIYRENSNKTIAFGKVTKRTGSIVFVELTPLDDTLPKLLIQQPSETRYGKVARVARNPRTGEVIRAKEKNRKYSAKKSTILSSVNQKGSPTNKFILASID